MRCVVGKLETAPVYSLLTHGCGSTRAGCGGHAEVGQYPLNAARIHGGSGYIQCEMVRRALISLILYGLVEYVLCAGSAV